MGIDELEKLKIEIINAKTEIKRRNIIVFTKKQKDFLNGELTKLDQELLKIRKEIKSIKCSELIDKLSNMSVIRDENGRKIRLSNDAKIAFIEEVKVLKESEQSRIRYAHSEGKNYTIDEYIDFNDDDEVEVLIIFDDIGGKVYKHIKPLDSMLKKYMSAYELNNMKPSVSLIKKI
jgi:hypothetical protein